MVFPDDPVILRTLLRAYNTTLRHQNVPKVQAHYEELIRRVEARLDALCGDHDCVTPEAWRASIGLR